MGKKRFKFLWNSWQLFMKVVKLTCVHSRIKEKPTFRVVLFIVSLRMFLLESYITAWHFRHPSVPIDLSFTINSSDLFALSYQRVHRIDSDYFAPLENNISFHLFTFSYQTLGVYINTTNPCIVNVNKHIYKSLRIVRWIIILVVNYLVSCAFYYKKSVFALSKNSSCTRHFVRMNFNHISCALKINFSTSWTRYYYAKYNCLYHRHVYTYSNRMALLIITFFFP